MTGHLPANHAEWQAAVYIDINAPLSRLLLGIILLPAVIAPIQSIDLFSTAVAMRSIVKETNQRAHIKLVNVIPRRSMAGWKGMSEAEL